MDRDKDLKQLLIFSIYIMGGLATGLKKYYSKEEVAKRKARPKNNKLAQQTIANRKKNKSKKKPTFV